MHYVSTRGGVPPVSFTEVLLSGLAPDGGLYVPDEYPAFDERTLRRMRDWSYKRIASFVLHLFIGRGIPQHDLEQIVERAYSVEAFGSRDITPIQPIGKNLALLKLSNGPTLAFKDVALRLVAELMDYTLGKKDRTLNILGATSGDTGSAAEEACRDKKNLRVFMLSPLGRMSAIQRLQMYGIDDPRIFNLTPRADFDSCQAAVKIVNEDAKFKEKYHIGAMNSINWARIAAQVVYWVYAYTRIASKGNVPTVVVPSGNFGNAYSAYVAARMGLPMRIVVATNENDVLHRFFQTGVYQPGEEEAKETLSPSMDIKVASNLERLLFDIVGRDSGELLELLDGLKKYGELSVKGQRNPYPNISFDSRRVSDEETWETIGYVADHFGVIVDPHTATALNAALTLCHGESPVLVAETAQPAKFPEVIECALGIKLAVPQRCALLAKAGEKSTLVPATHPGEIAEWVKEFIREKVPV
jgi:threonine synthase